VRSPSSSTGRRRGELPRPHYITPTQTERYGSTTSAARQRRRDSGLGRRIDGEPHAHAGEPTGSMFPSNTAPAKPNAGEADSSLTSPAHTETEQSMKQWPGGIN